MPKVCEQLDCFRKLKPEGTDHSLTPVPLKIAHASETVPVPVWTCNAQYQGLRVMIWQPMQQMGSVMINLHNTNANSNVSATCRYSNANKPAQEQILYRIGNFAGQRRHGCKAANLQVTVNVKVVLFQKPLSPFCTSSSQFNVADADFSTGSNRLQCCKYDLLLLEALYSIGGA